MSSNSPAPPLPLLLLLTCALLCSGCARAGDVPRIVKESRHTNGLTVGVPEGFEAKQTEDGFAVEPPWNRNLKMRDPVVAYVSLVRGGAPEESSLRTKSLGGKEVRYRVTKRENPGSAGDTYALEVFEPVPGGHLKYSQVMQSEASEPSFELCWTLVNSTKQVRR